MVKLMLAFGQASAQLNLKRMPGINREPEFSLLLIHDYDEKE